MARLRGIIICILWFNILLGQTTPPVLQWQKPLGGSLDDFGEDILLTTDGGFIVLGAARSNDGDGNNPQHTIGFNVFVAKYDANREFVWRDEYGGDGLDFGAEIRQVAGGYIILAGTNSVNFDVSGLHGIGPNPPPTDIWLIKIDNDGKLLWQKCLGGSGTDLPGSIDITPAGGYIISGYTNSNNGDVSGNHGGNGDLWVVELNATGDILWQRCYGGSGSDGEGGASFGGPVQAFIPFNQIKALTGGGYILTGTTESNDGDISGNHGDKDIWLARLDPAGNILWQSCHGGSGSEGPCGVIPLNDGYVVGGSSSSSDAPINNNGGIDGWMFKTDLNGNMLWQYNYGGNLDDICYDLLQAADGGFYMAGGIKSRNTCLSNGLEDFWTIRTSSEGKFLWEKLQGGSKDDYATSIALGADGLYLTGWELSNDLDVVGHHNHPNMPNLIANDLWIIIYGFGGADASPRITITASVETICEGKPVEFKAESFNSGTTPHYSWYVNGVEQMVYGPDYSSNTLQDGDIVTCKLFLRIPCMPDQLITSNAITIHWYPNGRVSGFLPLQITKCVNLYEELKPTMTFAKYLWSTGATTATIKIVNPGLYWLEVTDVTGCSGRENIWVTTKSCMNAVYIPSAFTPNNDGKNDIFKPLVDGKLLQYSFKIYDRWGQLVMQTTDPAKGWNGKRSGVDQDTNIYVWICTYQLEGEPAKTEKGTFLLMR
ncbi:MAG: T9SS type B sorting domain-containing protein [Chitinophagaceae bacterium]|nr:T9SS type B sorting domain-containing protein [Chitinophagaceae bacterium]